MVQTRAARAREVYAARAYNVRSCNIKPFVRRACICYGTTLDYAGSAGGICVRHIDVRRLRNLQLAFDINQSGVAKNNIVGGIAGVHQEALRRDPSIRR